MAKTTTAAASWTVTSLRSGCDQSTELPFNAVITGRCSFEEVWAHRDETSIPPGRSMDRAFSVGRCEESIMFSMNVFVITFIRRLLEWVERDERMEKTAERKASRTWKCNSNATGMPSHQLLIFNFNSPQATSDPHPWSFLHKFGFNESTNWERNKNDPQLFRECPKSSTLSGDTRKPPDFKRWC